MCVSDSTLCACFYILSSWTSEWMLREGLANRAAVQPAVEAVSEIEISLILQLVFVPSPAELWNLRITVGVDMVVIVF